MRLGGLLHVLNAVLLKRAVQPRPAHMHPVVGIGVVIGEFFVPVRDADGGERRGGGCRSGFDTGWI